MRSYYIDLPVYFWLLRKSYVSDFFHLHKESSGFELPADLSFQDRESRFNNLTFSVFRIISSDEHLTVEGDYMAQEIYVHRKHGRFSIDGERYSQETTTEKVQVNKTEPLKKELKTFLRAVRDKIPLTVTPQQELENMRICEKIQTGISQRGQVQSPGIMNPAAVGKDNLQT